MPPEDEPEDNYVYCEACSHAGGADRAIYHDDPPCKVPEWEKAGIACRQKRRAAKLDMCSIAEALETTVTRVSGMERGIFIPKPLVKYWEEQSKK